MTAVAAKYATADVRDPDMPSLKGAPSQVDPRPRHQGV